MPPSIFWTPDFSIQFLFPFEVQTWDSNAAMTFTECIVDVPVILYVCPFLYYTFLASCMDEFLFFHSEQGEDVSLAVWLVDFHAHSPLA